MEEYTIVGTNFTDGFFCPFMYKSKKLQNRCMGARCMAWIEEVDNEGNTRGRGRCGMVRQVIKKD